MVNGSRARRAVDLTQTSATRRRIRFLEGGSAISNRPAHRRVVGQVRAAHRYGTIATRARGKFGLDVATASAWVAPREVYRNLRAGAESGWDFSSRWMADGKTLTTIRVIDIVPPDLNSLLYNLETTLAKAYRQTKQPGKAKELQQRADARKAAMHRHLWDADKGVFTDYLWQEGRSTGHVTAATLYPLFFGIADRRHADRVAQRVRAELLQPHGLATTTIKTGQQWDAPNGWAPLQWIAIND